MSEQVKVSLQGISQDLANATGSFDPVDLGEMSREGLISLLQKVVRLKAPQPKDGQDSCPPSLVLECGGQTHAFMVENGALVDSESGSKLGLFDAVARVTKQGGRGGPRGASSAGAAPQGAPRPAPQEAPRPAQKPASRPSSGDEETPPLEWGSSNMDVKGLTPIRKKDVPPTDREVVEAEMIDLGPRAPQVSMYFWKSSNAKQTPLALLVVGLFFGLMAFALFAAKEPGAGVLIGAVAGFFFWLRGFLAGRAKTQFRIGFDWKTNTAWAKRDTDRIPSWTGNASCITGFTLKEVRSSRKVRTGGPMGTVSATEVAWELDVLKNNGSCVPFYSNLVTKAEAEEALAKATALLAAQD